MGQLCIWMCAQVKQSFRILSNGCHNTWWDVQAQREAGRGTLQDQLWHWQASCPCRDTQTIVNAFVKPLLSLLPSSPPALPCRLFLLRFLSNPGSDPWWPSPSTSPASITSLPSSCNPLQASTPFPGIPCVFLGIGQQLLAQAGIDTLETVCSSLGACRLTLSRAGLTFPDVHLGGFCVCLKRS